MPAPAPILHTDLTALLLPNLDRHLVLPLLDFLESKALYSPKEVLLAKYDLLKSTNMVNFVLGLKKELSEGEVEEDDIEFKNKEITVLAKFNELQASAAGVMEVISNPEVVSALRQDKLHNLSYLKDNHGVTNEQIKLLYEFGQFQYTIGHYSGASDYLYHFRVLSTDSNLVLSSMWGKLASDILEGNWISGMEELIGLRELIDSRGSGGLGGPLVLLQQRSWWLHWSLFIYFNVEEGREYLVESWLNPIYLNTLQTICPWLLRYLVVAIVIKRQLTTSLKQIIKLIKIEDYQFKDSITQFLSSLFIQLDFEQAKLHLDNSLTLIKNDFFLESYHDEFKINSLYLISETYCKIHNKININHLSTKLGMEITEGERWVVDLVRDAKLDAKIDFKENTIQMNHFETPVYQAVIEKSKGLLFRAQAITSAMEIRANGGTPDNVGRSRGGRRND